MSARVPLGVLDLVPVSAGSTAGEAIRNTIDLVQRAEVLGYQRYWFAEHHLNPGVAGSSPPILIALAAGATQRIRLGSGGVQSGHRTALAIVEEFGLVDALHPGRLDLGMGRSGGRNFVRAAVPPTTTSSEIGPDRRHVPSGLLVPPRPPTDRAARPPRSRLSAELLQQPAAESPEYAKLVHDVVGLIEGTYRSEEGLDPHPVPGAHAGVEVWVLGSSAGESATVAGELGLRFAANYHVSPATILEAVEGYRAAFIPSAALERPYVAVSADVVVADTDAEARELAAGYGPWVHSIRSGRGAIEFPASSEAHNYVLDDHALALVQDRIDTQFVGSPERVAADLERLQAATGADELIVTTITFRHADRVRSFELLAKEWMS